MDEGKGRGLAAGARKGQGRARRGWEGEGCRIGKVWEGEGREGEDREDKGR